MLISHVLAHFAELIHFFFHKCLPQCGILTVQYGEKSGDLFCLHALPHFASSNWPVITNLKNIADVRYDHASISLSGPVRGAKRARPCVITCQRCRKGICRLHESEIRQKLSPRVCLRAGICVIKPRYSAALHSSRHSRLRETFFAGGLRYVPVAP